MEHMEQCLPPRGSVAPRFSQAAQLPLPLLDELRFSPCALESTGDWPRVCVLGGGGMLPCVSTHWDFWSPPLLRERGVLLAFEVRLFFVAWQCPSG